jgi:hypothetical protein
LPSFKEYFLNLKKGNKMSDIANEKMIKSELDPKSLFNFSESINEDRRREEAALLYSKNITPEVFEKTFVKNKNEREEKMKKWITQEDVEDFKKIAFFRLGIEDPTDQKSLEKLKSENPEFFSEEAAIESKQTKNRIEELMQSVEDFEDRDEVEYYFRPESGETLEEHLAAVSKTRYSKVSLRRDDNGRIIIRKEFNHNYKYDLDEIMKFDIVNERKRLLNKLENYDFKNEISSNVGYYLNFYKIISYDDKYLSNLVDVGQEDFSIKVKSMIDKIDKHMKYSYEIDNFNFDDFKRLIENLLSMNPISLNIFVNNVIKLIKLFDQGQETVELTETLNEISDFSKDIFNEREVRIFVELMKRVIGSNVNLTFKNFDNFNKFEFIQDLLLKDFFTNLNSFLKGDEIIILFGILKLLPQNYPSLNLDDSKIKNRLTTILWENYKQHMLKEFNIVLKKENELKPGMSLKAAFEIKDVITKVSDTKYFENPNDVDQINKFSEKLKEYYVELTHASKNYF